MGCVQSSPTTDTASNEKTPEPLEIDTNIQHADGPKTATPSVNTNNKIANQRRRLSVAPGQVGNIDVKAIMDLNELQKQEEDVKNTVVTQFYTTSARSKKGFVPYNNRKQNQDAYLVHENLGNNPNVSIYGVFDGHGEVGEQVSGYCKEKFPEFFNLEGNLLDDPAQSILHCTSELCKALAKTKINQQFSGTTAVYAVRIEKKIYVANIGDSRCILARKDGPNGFRVVTLSNDHKPDVPEEKERILRAGGRVQPLQGLPDEDCGPARVWLKTTDVPGLAMSRSIGDEVSHRVGVIDIPEIIEYEFTDDDLFMIWASDGVWEFLSNEDVCQLIMSSAPNWEESVNAVIEAANNRWKEEEEVIDDITCVIFGFKAPYEN